MRNAEALSERKIFINSLKLTNFRNFTNLKLEFNSNLIALIGQNGVGKTNILEAISFLAPARGIRNAKLDEIENCNSSEFYNGWNISINFSNNTDQHDFSCAKKTHEKNRINNMDGDLLSKQQDLTKYSNIIWITPNLDSIFLDSKSERRKFFDRIVFNLFPEHLQNLLKYEHYLRERIQIFQNGFNNESWLDSIEYELSLLNSKISASRVQTIKYLNAELKSLDKNYPTAFLSFAEDAIFENMYLDHKKSDEIEHYSQKILKESRTTDSYKKQNSLGIHKTDFICHFLDKNMPAKLCSTGEQKSLLLSIILAKAKLLTKYNNKTPILLLDEIGSHLDKSNLSLFIENIQELNIQTFMSATNKDYFKEFPETQIIEIQQDH